jgi:hypothetical protein
MGAAEAASPQTDSGGSILVTGNPPALFRRPSETLALLSTQFIRHGLNSKWRGLHMTTFKLGKHLPKFDKRTLLFGKYLTSALQPPPPAVDYSKPVAVWPMMGNDTYGDCTCAAAGHMVEEWTANTGTEKTLSNTQILAAYNHFAKGNADFCRRRGSSRREARLGTQHQILKMGIAFRQSDTTLETYMSSPGAH